MPCRSSPGPARWLIAGVLSGLSTVYFRLGDFTQALEGYERLLRIGSELGDRGLIASVTMNMGVMYYTLGEHDLALEYYERRLNLSTELGDRPGIANATGNMGNVHYHRGEYDRALECYHRAVDGHAAGGRRYEELAWLASIAEALLTLQVTAGRMPDYLPKYLPDLPGKAPEESAPDDVPPLNGNDGGWRRAVLRRAREYVELCTAISSELSVLESQFDCGILLARLEAAEGDGASARERMSDLLRGAAGDEQRPCCHYWLWKLGLDRAFDHRAEAEALYVRLHADAPNYDYGRCIGELREAGADG